MSEPSIILIELSTISGNPTLQMIELIKSALDSFCRILSFQAIIHYRVNGSIWWKIMYLGQFYALHCPNWSKQDSKKSVLQVGTKCEAQNKTKHKQKTIQRIFKLSWKFLIRGGETRLPWVLEDVQSTLPNDNMPNNWPHICSERSFNL